MKSLKLKFLGPSGTLYLYFWVHVGMICTKCITEAFWYQPFQSFVFCFHVIFISRYQFAYFFTSDNVIIFVVCIESGEEKLVLKLDSNLRNNCWNGWCVISWFVCLFIFGATAPQWARASSFTRFLYHTQRRTSVGRTPLDEWTARRSHLYLITFNTHNRQTSMFPLGFEPTISAGERP